MEFGNVLEYDNIAIVVLFIIMVMQWVVIGKLLNALLATKDVLQKLVLTISVLNERLNRHDS